MKKKLMALGMASFLAASLVACANGDSGSGSSEVPKAENSAPAQMQASSKTYSAAQIEAALTAVQPSIDGNTAILSGSQVSQSLEATVKIAEQVKTEPAECAGTEQLQAGLSRANSSDLKILAESTGAVALVGLSGEMIPEIAKQAVANKKLVAMCATYTVTAASQPGTGTMEELDVSIPHDEAIAIKTYMEFAGTPTTTLNVNVIRGNTQIAATSNGPGATETPMSMQELEQLIDQTFVELEKQ